MTQERRPEDNSNSTSYSVSSSEDLSSEENSSIEPDVNPPLPFYRRYPFLTTGIILSIVGLVVGAVLSMTGMGAAVGAPLIGLGLSGLGLKIATFSGCAVAGAAIGAALGSIVKLVSLAIHAINSRFPKKEDSDSNSDSDDISPFYGSLGDDYSQTVKPNPKSQSNVHNTIKNLNIGAPQTHFKGKMPVLGIQIRGCRDSGRSSLLQKYADNRWSNNKLDKFFAAPVKVEREGVNQVIYDEYFDKAKLSLINIFIIVVDMTDSEWKNHLTSELRLMPKNKRFFIVGTKLDMNTQFTNQDDFYSKIKGFFGHPTPARFIGASAISSKDMDSEAIDQQVFAHCRTAYANMSNNQNKQSFDFK